ncbi:hypothetical protein RHECNPAF_2330019 [Rhizobium etli CNPAF512]|nr:hypothetical protein RHECNPAF_2330019 [Rhizobium etli CNPAF512]
MRNQQQARRGNWAGRYTIFSSLAAASTAAASRVMPSGAAIPSRWRR